MARKITEKQRAFTLKVFETNEPGTAYLGIYKVRSMVVASASASRLLTNVKVQELLQELRQKSEDASVGTVLERKQVATEIMRGRFADFMTNLTPEKLRSPALKEIKVTEGPAGKVTTIKLHSPLEGVDRLNTMDQIYKEGATVLIDNSKHQTVNIGEKGDAKELLLNELARYAARAREKEGDRKTK